MHSRARVLARIGAGRFACASKYDKSNSRLFYFLPARPFRPKFDTRRYMHIYRAYYVSPAAFKRGAPFSCKVSCTLVSPLIPSTRHPILTIVSNAFEPPQFRATSFSCSREYEGCKLEERDECNNRPRSTRLAVFFLMAFSSRLVTMVSMANEEASKTNDPGSSDAHMCAYRVRAIRRPLISVA